MLGDNTVPWWSGRRRTEGFLSEAQSLTRCPQCYIPSAIYPVLYTQGWPRCHHPVAAHGDSACRVPPGAGHSFRVSHGVGC